MESNASFLILPDLLSTEELKAFDEAYAQESFEDGRATASLAAREVKRNLQMSDSPKRAHLQQFIVQKIYTHPLINGAMMPARIYPPVFSRYSEGMNYGWHIDSPVLGQTPPLRNDLAMTIFLSEKDSYEGGELEVKTPSGLQAYKLDRGSAIFYPSYYVHRVAPVTSGERKSIVTWMQSGVMDMDKREVLFKLNKAHGLLIQKDMHSEEAQLVLHSYTQLMRLWAEF